jgi:uncharacterized protein with HEPN domain
VASANCGHLEAIDAARECTQDLDEAGLRTDRVRRLALLSTLTIIGEAVARLPQEVMDSHPEVPWNQMRAMRNVVVYEYFTVDTDALWQTAVNDLPPLEPVLVRILNE